MISGRPVTMVGMCMVVVSMRVGTVVIAMGIMNRVLNMLALRPARLAPERQEHQTPRVEAGQQSGEAANPEGEVTHLGTAGVRNLDDSVLREEAGEAKTQMVH